MREAANAQRAEWRVIREFRDDAQSIIVEVSKRCFGEYSFRVARWIDRGFTESLMPFIHVHVRDGIVPRFHDAVADLVDDARRFIKEDFKRDEARVAAQEQRRALGYVNGDGRLNSGDEQ